LWGPSHWSESLERYQPLLQEFFLLDWTRKAARKRREGADFFL